MQKSGFTGAHLEPYRIFKGRRVLNVGANSHISYSKDPQLPKKKKYHRLLRTTPCPQISLDLTCFIAPKEMSFWAEQRKIFSVSGSSVRNKKQTLSSIKGPENQNHTHMSFHSRSKAAWLRSAKAATAGRLGNFKTPALIRALTRRSK